MFSVTIKCADSAELFRLAQALEGFCAVQAGNVVEQASEMRAAEALAEGVRKLPGRSKRKNAAQSVAAAAQPLTDAAPAPEPTPVAGTTVTISDDDLVQAVRTAMRGEKGVAGVRAALDALGLKTAMDAKDSDARLKLHDSLVALAPAA